MNDRNLTEVTNMVVRELRARGELPVERVSATGKNYIAVGVTVLDGPCGARGPEIVRAQVRSKTRLLERGGMLWHVEAVAYL